MKIQCAKYSILGLCLAVGLAGCDQNPLAKIPAIQKSVEEQNARIDELEKKVKDLEVSKVQAELKLFLLELNKDPYKTATFDPAADQDFCRIDTSVGTFAVSIQEVKPQADGVKVRLHVGNLTSATVRGGTFKTKWGPAHAKSCWLELGYQPRPMAEDSARKRINVHRRTAPRHMEQPNSYFAQHTTRAVRVFGAVS